MQFHGLLRPFLQRSLHGWTVSQLSSSICMINKDLLDLKVKIVPIHTFLNLVICSVLYILQFLDCCENKNWLYVHQALKVENKLGFFNRSKVILKEIWLLSPFQSIKPDNADILRLLHSVFIWAYRSYMRSNLGIKEKKCHNGFRSLSLTFDIT